MLSFETGTRYLLVDDVGAWKAGQLGPLEEALAELPPETVLVLIARGKAVKQLAKAVEKAGGEVREYAAPKPWELPKWCVGHARELGPAARPGGGEGARGAGRLEPAAAVAGAGEDRRSPCTRRRTSRPPTSSSLAATDTAPGAYDLADALVAGDLQGDARAGRAARRARRAAGPARSSRSCAGCARCTGRPRCSTPACRSRRWARRLKGPPWADQEDHREGQEGRRGHARARHLRVRRPRGRAARRRRGPRGRGRGVLGGAGPRGGLGAAPTAAPSPRPYGYHQSFGAIFVSMWTCLVSWNASRPSWPSSRPKPDCFMPPNGPASLSVSGSLIQTVPGADLAHAAHRGLEVARVDVRAEAEARGVREPDRLVERVHRARSAPPGRRSPRAAVRSRPARRSRPRARRSGRARSRRGRRPPAARAPAPPRPRRWASTFARWGAETIGPTSVDSSSGSPTRSELV